VDPRDGEAGLEYLESLVHRFGIRGVKLYTAEWKGIPGDGSSPTLGHALPGKVRATGVKNIHVHKGPTIWPLNKDAFDVADIDEAATAFTDLNFIIEHCGCPPGGLLLDRHPGAQCLRGLPWSCRSSTAVRATSPRCWPISCGGSAPTSCSLPATTRSGTPLDRGKVHAFELPDDIQKEFGVSLTLDVKKKILGENAARIYGIDINVQKKELAQDAVATMR